MDPLMRRERLENLYRVMKAAPSDRIRIERWWCGTEGCLVGWAAQDPYFRESGLSVQTCDELGWPALGGQPLRCGDTVYADIGAFFGLSPTEASHLFGPAAYVTTEERDEEFRVRKPVILDRIVAMIDATQRAPQETQAPITEIHHA